MANNDDRDDISQHPPETDIDDYIPNIDGFRIERMAGDAVWLRVFSEDDEKDIHFDIYCDDGGLHVTRRDEHDVEV